MATRLLTTTHEVALGTGHVDFSAPANFAAKADEVHDRAPLWAGVALLFPGLGLTPTTSVSKWAAFACCLPTARLTPCGQGCS